MLIHLSLGDLFSETMSISLMDMDEGDDIILCWDWISSHALQARQVGLRLGRDQLQLALLPAAAQPPPAALSTVIGHEELSCLLPQIVSDEAPTVPAARTDALLALVPWHQGALSKGWSCLVLVDHTELAALESAGRQAARERLRHCWPSQVVPRLDCSLAKGVEVLHYGTELHLALFRLADLAVTMTRP